MPVVEVAGVAKSFGQVQAVRDVSFAVEGGEVFGLLGPNGAGKTTTIRMMLDIFRPDSGTISVFGGPMDEEKKRQVGYLPEERGLYGELRLLECLVYLTMLKGLPRHEATERVRSYLQRLGLADWAARKVKELSRGMQQKAQVIATLAHDPQLLILDEPFSGLDPVNTRQMKELLEEQRQQGKVIIMSTHQMHQVEAMCDRILLIDRGVGVLYGTLAEIRRQYAGNAVRVLLEGELDSLPGVINITREDGALHLALAEGVSPRDVLEQLCRRSEVQVLRFEVAAPSLDDIFVRVVSGGSGIPQAHHLA